MSLTKFKKWSSASILISFTYTCFFYLRLEALYDNKYSVLNLGPLLLKPDLTLKLLLVIITVVLYGFVLGEVVYSYRWYKKFNLVFKIFWFLWSGFVFTFLFFQIPPTWHMPCTGFLECGKEASFVEEFLGAGFWGSFLLKVRWAVISISLITFWFIFKEKSKFLFKSGKV